MKKNVIAITLFGIMMMCIHSSYRSKAKEVKTWQAAVVPLLEARGFDNVSPDKVTPKLVTHILRGGGSGGGNGVPYPDGDLKLRW